MRLKNNIYVLKGKKRWALYDFDREFVVPITDVELEVLRHLSMGKNWHYSKHRGTIYSKAFMLLKKQGFLIGGRPKLRSIDFPKIEKIPLPSKFSHVWLEVTNFCNLSCQHCYADSSPEVSREGELTVDEWKVVIDKLLAHGVNKITFIGGEPLTRSPLIIVLSKYIKEKERKTQLRIFSNLSFFPKKPELLEAIKEYDIHIGTSLYGTTASEHDKMTKLEGAWEKTTSIIKKLRSEKIPVFAGYYHNEENLINKEAVEKWIRSLGIEDFKIEIPSEVGRGQNVQWKLGEEKNDLPKRKYFSYASPAENVHLHNCFKDVLTVKYDGIVIPCIMQRNFPLIDLKEHSLGDLFANSMFQELAGLNKNKIEGCQECEFKYGCFDCRPDAMGTSTNLYEKPNCGYDPRTALSES